MDTIKNVTQLLIGKNIAVTGLTDLDYVQEVDDLVIADGEIVMTDEINRFLDGSSQPQNGIVKFIQRSGDILISSDDIILKHQTQYHVTTAQAEREQVDYVGFNTVDGAIEEFPKTGYSIRLNILAKDTAGFMQREVVVGTYVTGLTAPTYAQAVIATGLVASLRAAYSRKVEQDIIFSAITDDLGVALVPLLNTNKGSDMIVSNAVVTVGQYVRFGLTTDDPVAKVVALFTGAFKVNMIAQRTETDIAGMTVVDTGAWGVRIGGEDRQYVRNHYPSNPAVWVTQIDFEQQTATEITKDTVAEEGIGTGDQTNWLEKELQHDEFTYNDAEIPTNWREDSIKGSGVGYDLQFIEHSHVLSTSQGDPTVSPKGLQIAWRVGSNPQAAAVLLAYETVLTAELVKYKTQIPNLSA